MKHAIFTEMVRLILKVCLSCKVGEATLKSVPQETSRGIALIFEGHGLFKHSQATSLWIRQ